MLGRLLHLGSGGPGAALVNTHLGPTKTVASLESVHEDIHTRNLLFPDAQALYQQRNDQVFPLSTTSAGPTTSSSNPFDFNDDFDLDVRDVRTLIMQDAVAHTNTCLLFDSHPPPTPPAASENSGDQDAQRTPTSPRKPSSATFNFARPLVIQPDNYQMRSGAFDRRGSIHARSQSYAETESQRANREYMDELSTFSSCIFGNSELMSYKGTSTKVHVVPVEARPTNESSFGDGRSSIGRASGRSSRLSQSYSSQAISPTQGPSMGIHGTSSRLAEKKKVLITRLFPVNLNSDDADTTPHSRFSEESSGFPFPTTNEEATSRKKKPQPKQKRTPMYAVVLVIQLPTSASRGTSAAPKGSGYRESSSYNESDFFPSSYNSAKASGWNMGGSGTYGDATDSVYSVDVEDRIDSLTQHWDVIMRTLTHLQSVSATTIASLLKQMDLASPAPYSPISGPHVLSRTPSLTDRRSGEFARVKPPKSSTKVVALMPNQLADDAVIASEVETARHRIVIGLGASRVITGQGRWGIWRDEAIWVSKWGSSIDQRTFLHSLLTGFLGTHLDWLQALCPSNYRKRFFEMRRNKPEEDLALPARTVIISDDKMLARRLVFLLSAFLPASQQLPAARTHRPSTSTSLGGFSHSPPTYIIPILREESLRRKINRRTGLRRASHSRTASQSTKTSGVPAQLAHLSIERSHERRFSDAASIRTTTFATTGTGNDLVSRKSSAATTTTIVPETTTPHFSTLQRVESRRRPRPGSSGSVAAEDLKRSLQRGESSSNVSTTSSASRGQGLKWGNIVSGIWNQRRRDSVDNPNYQSGDLRSPVKASFSKGDKLADMVREVSVLEEEDSSDVSTQQRYPPSRETRTLRESMSTAGRETYIQLDRTPDPNGAFESPVKTSINADDGVIDVDITFPDYITSLESAISSPSSSGYLSTPGFPGALDSFEHSARNLADGDQPLNGAGWLNSFHPDFVIQAVPPRDGLIDDIKKALMDEPTPAPADIGHADMVERWVDVGSVLIGDTTKRTITRYTYRRLVKPRAADKQGSGTPGGLNVYGHGPHTPSIAPYETAMDDDWIEDTINMPDEYVADALEKVIGNFPDLGRDAGQTWSQGTSETRGSSEDSPEPSQHAQAIHDAPRLQCKTVVLSSLEERIRDVVDHRNHPYEYQKLDGNPDILRDAVRNWISNIEASARSKS